MQNKADASYDINAIIAPMQKLKDGAARLGLKLNPRHIEQFQSYYNELVDWSRRINLTAITESGEVQLKHFLDSISVIPALGQSATGEKLSLIDVGSGAGFPGLPIKIVLPGIKLTLLEATGKKAAFLHNLVKQLELGDVEVLTGRAEDIAHLARYRQQYNVVLSRAVATLPSLVELTLPFCAVGGKIIIQKKGDMKGEVSQAGRAIEILGGNQPKVKRIELTELPDEHCLVIIEKVSPTPTKYPRRPGIPAKRPIV